MTQDCPWFKNQGRMEIKALDDELNSCDNPGMEKLCECGCGEAAPIAKQTNKKWGHVKGEPVRFVRGHQGNLAKYRGGKAVHSCGYEQILAKDHPRADSRGYVSEHILICEKSLGKFLPNAAVIHHIDGDVKNNNLSNLLVCQDREYHNLLHRREKALKACGHASWRKCKFCKQWDSPDKLIIGKPNSRGSRSIYHIECRKLYRRKQDAKGK